MAIEARRNGNLYYYRKRRELLAALRESIQTSGATRIAAEQQLSSFFGGVWNEAEIFVNRLPLVDREASGAGG